ncbi:hypothetical protein BCR33DRAFT_852244 [Rhizoclosmatium globosum]|uniref:Uncharacterized protein n=1 Tax=Rhizoclosmatium globosum TaxID=329046 RepID=A0A1Y2C2W1_9FUNG|nr:hypothetical protein BCR33DRAFT_852244 [Rhizoclosmatium globosum]|eukprot:ORY41224.1 hypothetical protein BCR33DRAFT_852244 [Rhizoclosmatium globosum]
MSHFEESGWILVQDKALLGDVRAIQKKSRFASPVDDSLVSDEKDRRLLVFASDGSENSMRALKWGCKNLVNPEQDLIVVLSVGLVELDVSDVLMNATDALFQPLWGANPPNISPELNAKKTFALQLAKAALVESESVMLTTFNENHVNVPYQLYGVASDDVEAAIIDFLEERAQDVKPLTGLDPSTGRRQTSIVIDLESGKCAVPKHVRAL